jgi:hypothetical protein
MQTFDNITEAREGIINYIVGALTTESADITAKIRQLNTSPSPVDQIVSIAEYLYAKRAEISIEGKSLAAGLAAFATTNGWHNLLADNRGNKIVQALRRDLGETAPAGVQWPNSVDDPAASPAFAEIPALSLVATPTP